LPLILLVRFSKLTLQQVPSVTQEFVTFGDVQYELKAFVFGNDAHFIGRYKTGNGSIYEYDGMNRTASGTDL
jgi:hypothetical protein